MPEYLVDIIVPDIEIWASGDEDMEEKIKEAAWFSLFDDNDPSNWPHGTQFTIKRTDGQD